MGECAVVEVRSFVHSSLWRLFVGSFDRSFVGSFDRSFVLSFDRSFVGSFVCSYDGMNRQMTLFEVAVVARCHFLGDA